MAKQYTCDFCGEPISDKLMVKLTGDGARQDGPSARIVWEEVGHYHASGDQPCWAEMVDRVQLIHAVSSDLGPDREAIERRIEKRTHSQREREEWEDQLREQAQRTDAWRRRPQLERDGLLLRVLGEQRLTISELTERLNAELGVPPDKLPTVYGSTVKSMAMRMVHRGQLDRAAETFNVNHIRHRYFRPFNVNHIRHRYFRPGLADPIADLERAYNDDDEAVA